MAPRGSEVNKVAIKIVQIGSTLVKIAVKSSKLIQMVLNGSNGSKWLVEAQKSIRGWSKLGQIGSNSSK